MIKDNFLSSGPNSEDPRLPVISILVLHLWLMVQWGYMNLFLFMAWLLIHCFCFYPFVFQRNLISFILDNNPSSLHDTMHRHIHTLSFNIAKWDVCRKLVNAEETAQDLPACRNLISLLNQWPKWWPDRKHTNNTIPAIQGKKCEMFLTGQIHHTAWTLMAPTFTYWTQDWSQTLSRTITI